MLWTWRCPRVITRGYIWAAFPGAESPLPTSNSNLYSWTTFRKQVTQFVRKPEYNASLPASDAENAIFCMIQLLHFFFIPVFRIRMEFSSKLPPRFENFLPR